MKRENLVFSAKWCPKAGNAQKLTKGMVNFLVLTGLNAGNYLIVDKQMNMTWD
jgi:hypothetical protein